MLRVLVYVVLIAMGLAGVGAIAIAILWELDARSARKLKTPEARANPEQEH